MRDNKLQIRRRLGLTSTKQRSEDTNLPKSRRLGTHANAVTRGFRAS